MKRLFKILLPIMAVLATALVFVACSSVDGISIDENSLSQTTFVQGNDLDLSGCMLIVRKGDGTERISLTASGVTVSGYNKNKLGEQTITIEYEGQSTTLTVTVVPRLSAENYESNYFVGEKFNTSRGRLRVYNDDGSSKTISLKDNAVKVGEMDSSRAIQPVDVDVRYTTNDGTVYTGTIEVNIYDIDSAKMKNPTKISYKSHEQSLDLTGGYITLHSDEIDIDRTVLLTDEGVEITGYNPSAATTANRTEELSQQITVKYLDNEFKFNVGIRYSDVSVIWSYVEDFIDVDMNELTVGQGAKALASAELYLGLSAADSTYISDDQLEAIVRVGTYYGFVLWRTEFNKYSDVFTVYNGSLTAVCKSYQATKAAYNALIGDSDNVLFTVAGILKSLEEQFPDYVVFEGEEDEKGNVTPALTVADIVAVVVAPEDMEHLLDEFKFMMDLYDALDAVPENWKTSDPQLSDTTNDAAVNSVITLFKLYASEYSDRTAYILLSGWRNDYFEIIYTNCYYQNKPNSISAVKDYHLYGELEELYEQLVMAYNQVIYMILTVNSGYLYSAETTMYMWYMRNALGLLTEIASSEDEMLLHYASGLTFAGFYTSELNVAQVYNLLLNANYGYVYHMGAMLDDERVDALWDKYLDLFDGYVSASNVAEYLGSSAFVSGAMEMLDMFIELAPAEQLAFVQSVSYLYGTQYNYPELAFEHEKGFHSYFAMFLANGIYAKLGGNETDADEEKVVEIVDAVLYSIENYFRYYVTAIGSSSLIKLTAFNEFKNRMAVIEENKALLAADETLNAFYTKYSAIRGLYGATMSENDVTYTEEEQAKLDAFKALYTDFALAFNYITNQKQSINAFGLLIAVYEKWCALETELLNSGNQKLINGYLYLGYKMNDKDTTGLSLGYYKSVVRSMYVNLSMSFNISGFPIYSVYAMVEDSEAMRDFMIKAYPIMSTAIWNLIASVDDNGEEPAEYNQAEIDAALAAFAALNGADRQIFRMIVTGMDLFTTGLLEHYGKLLDEDANNAFTALLTLINADAVYEFNKGLDSEEEAKASLKKYYDALVEAYEALGDSTEFDSHFKSIYDTFVGKCKELFAED